MTQMRNNQKEEVKLPREAVRSVGKTDKCKSSLPMYKQLEKQEERGGTQ